MAKQLVVFYSRKGENHFPGGIRSVEKGNTAYAAEYIQAALQADIFEIDTVVPYAANYRECCAQAVAENKAKAGLKSRVLFPTSAVMIPFLSATPAGAALLPCVCSPSWNIMISPERRSCPCAPMRAVVWVTVKPA